MSGINDEMSGQRNSEIANDNYYDLKWLNAAVDNFLNTLAEAREVENPQSWRRFVLDEVYKWAEVLRKLRRKP